ncbi:hypothetical protein A3715_08120 [Oleiphilus sp. HI0009]|nr:MULTISPECIES: fatty acid desaturase family protein [unclassified Oleiphilus]KZX80505.1 hypothetical protein A3715_08120 [Oleiphilus sp. HI0009]KZY67074.1 hypothetical protein A3739_22190 [Oleiphilus sp. HI0067]KZY67130.1 hypothetical protein A3738_05480 [Oleiphilus sp. HI0066]KZY67352.1 hypothetical protein A3739_12865 [Oleiphilus sp. HI0067]
MSKLSYKQFLNSEELKEFRKANDLHALWMFAVNWAVIAACFVVFAAEVHWLFKLAALFVLGGRQLGLGILMHECGHQGFFSKLWMNRFFGHWFAGMTMLVPLEFYRTYHLIHHSKTGTDDDPDVGNIKQYPVTGSSLRRKILRDFTGFSGLKMLYGVLFYVMPNRAGNAVSLGVNQDSVQKGDGVALRNFRDAIVLHGSWIAVFTALGHPALYLMWWVGYIFFYPFVIRVRQIAEHGAMPALASDDVRDTTRTTIVSLWERAFFAPNFVNFHCEHHFLPSVPSYNLPRLHHVLKERGFYQDKPESCVDTGGYREILRIASAA